MMSTRIASTLLALMMFLLGALPTADGLWSASATVDMPRSAISLSSTGFTPAILVVTVGAEVTWTNETDQTQIVQSGILHRLYLPLTMKASPATLSSARISSTYLPLLSQPAESVPSTAQAQLPYEAARTATSFRATLPPGTSFTYTFTAVGDYPYFLVSNEDLRGRVVVVSEIPPDPADVAPPLDQTVVTDLATATEFLYTGVDPIQSGVLPGTIEARRVAVIRGRVLDADGKALPGVVLTVLDHPEYGQTRSRAAGLFDLAVNGGGLLTVVYTKAGYPTLQRQIETPWQDYVWLPDVVMIPYDAQVTAINLGGSNQIQVARGSIVSDKDGVRQSTLLFPPGVQATMIVAADGVTSRSQLSTMHVRATEYTVGDTGPAAMPAALPDNVGYTYAVEFSADEAVVAGAVDVQFDQPVINYVENFLGAPVGGIVPVGYYDKVKAAWIPSENGLVVKILSIQDGKAQLDLDGSGKAASSSALAALGVTADEQVKLAQLYQPGQSLWRVPIAHFTPWDCNWPYGPPDDAGSPRQPDPIGDPPPRNPCQVGGSIIECQSQVLGEALDVAGTPFRLHYRSDRVPGRTAARTLEIPLSGPSVPASLVGIELQINVAGRPFTHTIRSEHSCLSEPAGLWSVRPAQMDVDVRSPIDLTNQSYTFVWDGKDAYGRSLPGSQTANVRIGYVYCGVYMQPAEFERSFGRYSGVPIEGSQTRQEITLWQEWQTSIRAWSGSEVGLGGWSLDGHHLYDPDGKLLYLGDGTMRSVDDVRPVIDTVAGSDDRWCAVGTQCGDGGPALDAPIDPTGIAVGPDGSLYIADARANRIRRVGPDGIITSVAGSGLACADSTQPCGDGGPALEAEMSILGGWPNSLTFGPDGSLYIADNTLRRVRRIDPNGAITTVAGDGNWCDCSGCMPWIKECMCCGEGGPANQAQLSLPTGIAVGPDGSLYITDFADMRVRRVGPDGNILAIVQGYTDQIWGPAGIDVASDGAVYYADWLGRTVSRLGPDGSLDRFVNIGWNFGCGGDGEPAAQAELLAPVDLVAFGDSLYIADEDCHVVRRIASDGIVTTIAGRGPLPETMGWDWESLRGDGGLAVQAQLFWPRTIAVGPDGSLYIADHGDYRVRRVRLGWPGFSQENILIPSADGSQFYTFDGKGRHLRTLDSLTGAVLMRFVYDSQGRLIQVVDGDGNVTAIERNSQGNPTAIVSPYGQRMLLGVDANGYLASVTNPAGEATRFTYTAGGLLRTTTDPRGGVHRFTYDDMGRLIQDQNPAGGVQILARMATSDAVSVTLTTALSRTTTYAVANLSTGAESRTNTFPDGTYSQAWLGTNGGNTTTLGDGTVIADLQGPDPRFGMQAPLATSSVVTTPGGLALTIAITRSVKLADPLNIASLETQTDTVSFNGRLYSSLYQAAERTFVNTTPLGRNSTTTIDAQGRITEEQVGGLLPLSYGYDSRGRLTTVTQGSAGEARTISLSYNAGGHVETITGPLNRVVRFAYDPAGRVTTQTMPDGGQILYGYDANGNVTSITPPGRPAHLFTYTPDNLVATYTPPSVGAGSTQTNYTYDLDRQVTRVSRPDGRVVDFGYDSSGRLATLTLARGQLEYTYAADTGQVATITTPGGGALAYSYDGALITGQAWSGPITGSVQYGYDDDFRLASLAVNGGNAVAFAYDDDDLLTLAGDLRLSRDAQNGLLTGATLGDVGETWSYNGFGELATARATYNGADLLTIQYSYDKLGRITTRTETVGGQTTRYNYGYDLRGRLAEVKKNNAVVAVYTYDSNGNRLSYVGPGGAVNGAYDNQDRLLQYGNTTYTYTANGELLSKTSGGRTTTYTYDELGNLIGVNMADGAQIEYLIDGQNRRIGKKVNGVFVQGFLYQDQLNPVAEIDGNGNIVSYFIYASRSNTPDYMVKGGATYRIIADHLGSPRLVVDVTSGTIVQRIDYDAFGNVVQDTNTGFQPFGFAGGVYDPQTRLVRFGARDYDADTGRWTVKDLRFSPGSETNLYAYLGNDPVNFVDPLGLQTNPGMGCENICLSRCSPRRSSAYAGRDVEMERNLRCQPGHTLSPSPSEIDDSECMAQCLKECDKNIDLVPRSPLGPTGIWGAIWRSIQYLWRNLVR